MTCFLNTSLHFSKVAVSFSEQREFFEDGKIFSKRQLRPSELAFDPRTFVACELLLIVAEDQKGSRGCDRWNSTAVSCLLHSSARHFLQGVSITPWLQTFLGGSRDYLGSKPHLCQVLCCHSDAELSLMVSLSLSRRLDGGLQSCPFARHIFTQEH